MLSGSLYGRKLVVRTTDGGDGDGDDRPDDDRLAADSSGYHLLYIALRRRRVGFAQKKKPRWIVVHGCPEDL